MSGTTEAFARVKIDFLLKDGGLKLDRRLERAVRTRAAGRHVGEICVPPIRPKTLGSIDTGCTNERCECNGARSAPCCRLREVRTESIRVRFAAPTSLPADGAEGVHPLATGAAGCEGGRRDAPRATLRRRGLGCGSAGRARHYRFGGRKPPKAPFVACRPVGQSGSDGALSRPFAQSRQGC